jgi:uncharacterized protein (TIGR02996 family)
MSAAPGSADEAREDRLVIPGWRKALFAAIAVAFAFALVELVLALFGIRPLVEREDPFVGFSGHVPLFVEERADDGTHWLRTAPGKLRWFNDQRFRANKPAGVKRVFCLGGSTTQGQPFEDRVAFPGWLRELLTAADETCEWEVVNAGGISYASYRVVLLMEELAACQPDLFILYTGHNEFLEERTYGGMREQPRALRAAAALAASTRVAAVMDRVIGPRASGRPMLTAEVDAALDRSIGPETYERNDPLRDRVLEHFEFNLRRMTGIARRAGAAMMLVVPASNLKDSPPFKSQHRDDLTEHVLRTWQWLSDQAGQALSEERHEDAAGLLRQAERIDPRHAGLQDQLGGTLFALGRHEEARVSFLRAIDEDVCPLRAISPIPFIIESVARSENVPLVDFRALIDAACLERHGHNVPGREFFVDHVHPTIEGHRLLAGALLETMAEFGLAQPRADWRQAVLPVVIERVESGFDHRARGESLRNLAKVLAWAGRHEEAGRLALEALAFVPDDAESHYLAGCYFKHLGEFTKAVKHFLVALPSRPDDGEARRLLASSLAGAGQWQESLAHFEVAVRLLPNDPGLAAQHAVALARSGQTKQAIKQLRLAVDAQPDDAGARYNLGVLLREAGELEPAARELEHSVILKPDDMTARLALAGTLIEAGHPERAVEHLRLVLERHPDSEHAKDALRRATSHAND